MYKIFVSDKFGRMKLRRTRFTIGADEKLIQNKRANQSHNTHPPRFTPRKGPSVFIIQEAGWAPEPI
jgi:hypothetical protein